MLVSPKLLDKLKSMKEKKMRLTGKAISLWEITDTLPNLRAFEDIEKQFLEDLENSTKIDIKLKFDSRREF